MAQDSSSSSINPMRSSVQEMLTIPGMLGVQLVAQNASPTEICKYPARISKEGNDTWQLPLSPQCTALLASSTSMTPDGENLAA